MGKTKDDAAVPEVLPEHDVQEQSLVPLDPLRQYLSRVQQYPMLTLEKERALAEHYRETGDPEAARSLVASHLRLVVRIAMEYRSAYYNLIDLIQEGNVGLLTAVQKFDPEKGARLSYYASWWIRSYILKYLLDNFRLIRIGTTKAQRRLFYNLVQEKQRIEAMGFQPDAHLLAGRLGVTVDDIEMMSQRLAQSEYSLDAPVSTAAGAGTFGDFVADDDVPIDEKLAQEELRDAFAEKLKGFVGQLSTRDQSIFQERLVAEIPRTLQDIADEYHISKERARQLEQRILQKLRDYMIEAGIAPEGATPARIASPKGWEPKGSKDARTMDEGRKRRTATSKKKAD
jgi:RNA polymerase sigma-32 factor